MTLSAIDWSQYTPRVGELPRAWQFVGGDPPKWANGDTGEISFEPPPLEYRAPTWRDFQAEGLWKDLGDPSGAFWRAHPYGMGSPDPHNIAVSILQYMGPGDDWRRAVSTAPGVPLSAQVLGEMSGTEMAGLQDAQSQDFLQRYGEPLVFMAAGTALFAPIAAAELGGGAQAAMEFGTVDPVSAFDAAQGTSLFETGALAPMSVGEYFPDFPVDDFGGDAVIDQVASGGDAVIEPDVFEPDAVFEPDVIDVADDELIEDIVTGQESGALPDFPAPAGEGFSVRQLAENKLVQKVFSDGAGLAYQYVRRELQGGSRALVPQRVNVPAAQYAQLPVRRPLPLSGAQVPLAAATEWAREHPLPALAVAGGLAWLVAWVIGGVVTAPGRRRAQSHNGGVYATH